MRRALVAAAFLVGACSSTPPAPPAPPATTPVNAGSAAPVASSGDSAPSLDSEDSKRVAKTLAKVSAMRGIQSTKPVPGVTLERSALVGRIKDKALREYPPEALKREGQLLQLAGFAPPSFDYLGEMMKLLEAQLEGFYEPKNGTMYLAGDLEGDAAKATLAHELVHALQDQRWDLKKRSDYKPGQSDQSMALACLAEGDATSLMLDYILGKQGRSALDVPADSLRALMQGGMNTPDTEKVPHIMRSSLIAPYEEGVDFVNKLRVKGGWDAVNHAWDKTPTTTEQILHLEKWEKGEQPLAVPAPSASALGSGWKLEDEDNFGELGFALMYEEWMSETDARLAASGWGGDRSSFYAKGDELAYAVHERFDEAPKKADAFAERAMTKLTPALKKAGLGTAAIADANNVCFERPKLGPLLFARRGRELVFINGPAKVTKDGTWSSTATCALAKTWADEIAAQK